MLGLRVGNHELVAKIGEGGMGTVYLAEHTSLGRLVAVKILHADLSGHAEIKARFEHEARAVAAIHHPGVVEVYDAGVLADGHAYIVMEFLDGESLAARIARGRCSLAATLAILRAIARALQAAHELAIVHRDLKPDNIFLVPDAELASGERVKLLDFGIAKQSAPRAAGRHTEADVVMGTPLYMSPEQCRGAGTVDHRADLYALGCIAYEMLCDAPPFLADGAGEVLARHLYFAPVPPRELRPDLPIEVEALVLSLLRKEPRERPSSAIEVVRMIDRLAVSAVPALADERRDASVVTGLPLLVAEHGTLARNAPPPPVVVIESPVAARPDTTLSLATISDVPAPRRVVARWLAVGGPIAAMVGVLAVVGMRAMQGPPVIETAVVAAVARAVPPPPPVIVRAAIPDAVTSADLASAIHAVAPPVRRKIDPCSRAAFAPVIAAVNPAKSRVYAELAHLQRCERRLGAAQFQALQSAIVDKL